MNKTKIIIIGGGFGGIYTAKYLEKYFNKDNAEITLINKSNYFLFTPLLHEVATGGLTHDSIIEPIREIFRGDHVKFVEDTVVEVKKDSREVITSHATFNYDYLVVSPGAETNYYGTPGAQENSFTLKNLEDAIALRNHIIQTFEKATKTKNKDLLTYAIVGAGATGVELASEIIEYVRDTMCSYYMDSGFSREDIKIFLITGTPDLISQFPIDMRELAMTELQKKGIIVKTNMSVVKVDPHLISFGDKTTLSTHTIIWVAGVRPTISSIKGLDFGAKGRMDINEFLQNNTNPEIFSLGDVGGAFPMLAQVAVRQAKIVASNIFAKTKNAELSKFSFEQKILLISLGQWYALGHFGGITLRGRIMWLIWRTVYLFNFISWRKKFEILVEWITNLFYPRDISYIK